MRRQSPASDAWGLVNDLESSLANPDLGTPYAKNKALGALFQRVTIEGVRGDYWLEFTLQPLFADVANCAL